MYTHTHNQKKSRKRLIDLAFYFKYPNIKVGVNGEKIIYIPIFGDAHRCHIKQSPLYSLHIQYSQFGVNI